MSPAAASPLGGRSLSSLLLPFSASPVAEAEPAAESEPTAAAAVGPSRSATLRANLEAQGLDEAAINTILEHNIPPDFLPHSARHAGIAHQRREGMSDDDVMHHANMSARTYVVHYRRKIRAVRSLGSGG